MRYLILTLLIGCGHGNEAQHIHHEKEVTKPITKLCYYSHYYECYGCDYYLPNDTLFACDSEGK